MFPHLQELAVLLALQRVGDLPPGRAEPGVPAVVVAALRHEGVAAAGPRLPQQALVHTLARGAAQEAAGGDQGRAAGRGVVIQPQIDRGYLYSLQTPW